MKWKIRLEQEYLWNASFILLPFIPFPAFHYYIIPKGIFPIPIPSTKQLCLVFHNKCKQFSKYNKKVALVMQIFVQKQTLFCCRRLKNKHCAHSQCLAFHLCLFKHLCLFSFVMSIQCTHSIV